MTQGFTLIELLVVVLIIGILSAVALPQYQTAVERSRATEALTQMAAVRGAMERYYAQHDKWPTTFNQLDVDIPKIEEGKYGGKNFTISFSSNVITAKRTRASGGYTLTTTISEDDGAFSAVRACAGDDDDGTNFCYAIAGGQSNVSNF